MEYLEYLEYLEYYGSTCSCTIVCITVSYCNYKIYTYLTTVYLVVCIFYNTLCSKNLKIFKQNLPLFKKRTRLLGQISPDLIRKEFIFHKEKIFAWKKRARTKVHYPYKCMGTITCDHQDLRYPLTPKSGHRAPKSTGHLRAQGT